MTQTNVIQWLHSDSYGVELALLVVILDDGLGCVVKRLQSLLDRILVVVHATARLGSLEQALRHRLVAHLEVNDALDRRDLSTKKNEVMQRRLVLYLNIRAHVP